ncbi:MAG: GNAT family N-acetyltransferase [Bacteroidota bacterium]
MRVAPLLHTPISEIVDCLVKAFDGYYVRMPENVDYYIDRWARARVRYDLSFGMFDKEQLVGFIINGLDKYKGYLTAFNTGTGVLPEYRGKGVVYQLYEAAMPRFLKVGVEKCVLEVISINDRAVHVYKKIGFRKTRDYHCFKGVIEDLPEDGLDMKNLSFEKVNWSVLPLQEYICWDNQPKALEIGQDSFVFFEVHFEGRKLGFFAVNPNGGYLPQFEIYSQDPTDWKRLFAAIRQVRKKVSINNIDHRLTQKRAALQRLGFENHVNQFEMEMPLS